MKAIVILLLAVAVCIQVPNGVTLCEGKVVPSVKVVKL